MQVLTTSQRPQLVLLKVGIPIGLFLVLLVVIMRSESHAGLSNSRMLLEWAITFAGLLGFLVDLWLKRNSPRSILEWIATSLYAVVAGLGLLSLTVAGRLKTLEPLSAATGELRLTFAPTELRIAPESGLGLSSISLIEGKRAWFFMSAAQKSETWGSSNLISEVWTTYRLLEGSEAIGKPFSFMERADTIQFQHAMLPIKTQISTGYFTMTLNGSQRKTIPIPAQEAAFGFFYSVPSKRPIPVEIR